MARIHDLPTLSCLEQDIMVYIPELACIAIYIARNWISGIANERLRQEIHLSGCRVESKL